MTMTPQQIEQFVDALYDATGTADWDGAAALLTDDFVVTEADPLPMAGVYRGKNALKELYQAVMEIADVAGFDRIQTTVGGDYAVCILSIQFVDPALAPAELCELFRFKDGKCCEIKPYYFDPAQFIAAAEAKQKAAALS
jgi:SnoaL-like domain